MFYCRSPLNAKEESRLAMANFFTRANYGMVVDVVVGNFELDMNDGELRYKISVDAEGVVLSTVFLKNISYTTVATMDRYMPGIMKVLSGIDPVAAIQEVE